MIVTIHRYNGSYDRYTDVTEVWRWNDNCIVFDTIDGKQYTVGGRISYEIKDDTPKEKVKNIKEFYNR